MNIPTIRERKETLIATKEQRLNQMKVLLAEIKQIDGRLSECDYWLTVLDRKDTARMIDGLRNAVEQTGQSELAK